MNDKEHENNINPILSSTSIRKRSLDIYTNDINSNDLNPIYYSGLLKKRGYIRKNWLIRLFILRKSSICYYKRNKSKKPWIASIKYLKGEIKLSNIIKVDSCYISNNIKKNIFMIRVLNHNNKIYNTFYNTKEKLVYIYNKKWISLGSNNINKSNIYEDNNQKYNTIMNDKNKNINYRDYYIEAPSLEEKERWIRFIHQALNNKIINIGQDILDYIINNKKKKLSDSFLSNNHSNHLIITNITQINHIEINSSHVGKLIVEEFPVLSCLLYDAIYCTKEDELIHIFDQIQIEIEDGAYSEYIKKAITAIGEKKIIEEPCIWTLSVQTIFANIMKIFLYMSKPINNRNRSKVFSSFIHNNTSNTNHTISNDPIISSPLSFQKHEAMFSLSNNKNSLIITPNPVRLSLNGSIKHFENLKKSNHDINVTSFDDIYSLGRVLGSGSSSVVHVGYHKISKKQFAIKCIPKKNLTTLERYNLKQEIIIMKKLDHPNLIKLYDSFNEKDCYYLVLSLCTGGDLFDQLISNGHFTEDKAKIIFFKLANAITYLHNVKNIIHRDIKPENILLKSSGKNTEVIIADFGFAKEMISCNDLNNIINNSTCGTPGYIAPEILLHENYSYEVDCWSLGVVLYILLSGSPPFPGKTEQCILNKVSIGSYSMNSTIWIDIISENAKDLVKKLLNKNTKERIKAEEILKHPWFYSLYNDSIHLDRHNSLTSIEMDGDEEIILLEEK